MGKKSGRNGRDKEEEGVKAREFVLKVAMHCHCNGCIDKIRGAVKGLALLPGIEAVDQSALESKGEVKLVATADPEKLRQRLRKATRKHVDLILPKETKTDKADKDAAAAAAQALLPNSLQAQYGGQGAWANQLLPGAGGWNTRLGYGYGTAGAAQAYPWAAQQPDPYSAAYTAAGGAWGAYAYPPVHGHGGAWHAHGY